MTTRNIETQEHLRARELLTSLLGGVAATHTWLPLNSVVEVVAVELERLTHERDAAVADNAVLIRTLGRLPIKVVYGVLDQQIEAIMHTKHPGTALLEELAQTKAALGEALEVLTRIHNMTDGHPIDADRRDRIYQLTCQGLAALRARGTP